MGKSRLEKELNEKIRQSGLPQQYAREYRFHKSRKWRFDFAWPDCMVAVEVDGGIYSGGRHNRGEGFKKDAEKGNAALLDGWRVLHFTTSHLARKEIQKTIQTIDELIRKSVTWRSGK
jgi:very-short-patch-repair endonuclease